MIVLYVVVCGENMNEEQGIIYSPGYPGNLPNNRECIWTINLPEGRQVMLNMSDFYLPDRSSDCSSSFLEIR